MRVAEVPEVEKTTNGRKAVIKYWKKTPLS